MAQSAHSFIRVIVLGALLLPFKNTKAQSVSKLMGARAAGMGYASAALTDEWSLFNNVGGLSAVRNFSLATAYEVTPALPGADRAGLAVLGPVRKGAWGVGVFRFGDDLYNEHILTAGFSNRFGLASLGLRLNYIQYRAEGFGTQTAFSVDFGGVAELSPYVSVGAYITNLNQPQLSTGEDLPTKLALGAQFKPVPSLAIAAEIEKDLTYAPTIKAGIDYALHKKIQLRSGFNLNPNSLFAGLGYKAYRLNIDNAIQWNPQSRMTYQISATYRIGKAKE